MGIVGVDCMNEEIEKKAKELGKAIASSEEYKRYVEAREEVERDEKMQELFGRYEQLRDEFYQALESGQGNEELLGKIDALEKEISSNPKMKEYMEAEANFKKLIDKVNEKIAEGIQE